MEWTAFGALAEANMGPAPMSGDLLIPARARGPELEVPGSAEPSRQAALRRFRRRQWAEPAFAALSRDQRRSLEMAKPRALPAWLGPGVRT
jgi:hypothetical protein